MENIGKIFKSEREKRKLSIEQVCNSLKIRQHILTAIEHNDLSILPAAYMRAFIRDYAAFLKLEIDIDEIMLSIKPKDSIERMAEASKKNIENKEVEPKRYEEIFSENKIKRNFFNKNNIANYLIYSALVLILVSVIYFTFFDLSSSSPAERTEYAIDAADTTLIGMPLPNSNQDIIPTDSMTLNISSSDTVWMRIAGDGKISRQLVLYPDQDLDFKALEYFQITCDNASVLTLRRNDELLPKLNTKGNVIRNVKITRTEIINPTSVYSDSLRKSRKKAKKAEEAPKKPILISPSIMDRKK